MAETIDDRTRMAAAQPSTSVVTRSRGSDVISAGIAGGLIGGALMMACAMIYSGIAGAGFWLPPRAIAACAFGVDALLGGAGIVLAGFAIHFGMAALSGIIFAALLPRRMHMFFAALIGMIYTLAILVFTTDAILPVIDPTMAARVLIMSTMWIMAHLIYGLGLSSVPLLRHDMVVKEERVRTRPLREPAPGQAH